MRRVLSSRWADPAGLLLLWAVVAALELHLTAANPVVPVGDYAAHLMHTAAFHRLFAADVPLAFKLEAGATWFGRYPPAAYAWSALVYAFTGPGPLQAVMSQVLLLVPIFFATFYLCRLLAGRTCAWAAVLLVASSPNLLYNARQYMLDVPASTFVPLTLYCLYASDAFARRWPAVFAGAFLALGLLCKWSFGFWVMPAFAAFVVTASWKEWRQRGPWFLAVHWLLAVALALVAVLFGLGCYKQPSPQYEIGPTFLVWPCWRSWMAGWWLMLLGYLAVARVLDRRMRPGEAGLSRSMHVQLGIVTWLALIGPWFLSNMRILAEIWLPVQLVHGASFAPHHGAYVQAILQTQISVWWGFCLAGCVLWLHPKLRQGGYLALAFAMSCYFYVGRLTPTSRYMASFVPQIAILSVYWTSLFPRFQRAVLGLALLTAVAVWGVRWDVGVDSSAPPMQALASMGVMVDAGGTAATPVGAHLVDWLAAQRDVQTPMTAVITTQPGGYLGVVPLWLELEGLAMFNHPDMVFMPVFLQEHGAELVHLYDVCPSVHVVAAGDAARRKLPPMAGPLRAWRPDFVVMTYATPAEREQTVRLLGAVMRLEPRTVATWWDTVGTVELARAREGGGPQAAPTSPEPPSRIVPPSN